MSDFSLNIPKNCYEDWQLEAAQNHLKNFDNQPILLDIDASVYFNILNPRKVPY